MQQWCLEKGVGAPAFVSGLFCPREPRGPAKGTLQPLPQKTRRIPAQAAWLRRAVGIGLAGLGPAPRARAEMICAQPQTPQCWGHKVGEAPTGDGPPLEAGPCPGYREKTF